MPQTRSKIVSLKEEVNRLRLKLADYESRENELQISLQLLRENEVVYRSIIDTAADAVIAYEETGEIIQFNPSAEKLFGYDAEEIIGNNIDQLIPPKQHEKLEDYIKGYLDTGICEIIGNNTELEGMRKDGTTFQIEMTISEMALGYRRVFTIVMRDITARKLAEAERENLILELKEAINNVKTLSGLIPICSGCKKVRDDTGYWQQVESYISHHCEADFSHSLCPDCMEKLYPKYYKKLSSSGN